MKSVREGESTLEKWVIPTMELDVRRMRNKYGGEEDITKEVRSIST